MLKDMRQCVVGYGGAYFEGHSLLHIQYQTVRFLAILTISLGIYWPYHLSVLHKVSHLHNT